MFTIIILITALISGIGSFVSGVGKIVVKHKNGKRTLTKAGYVFLTCNIILVLLPPIQNWLQEKHNKKVEVSQQQEQDKREARQKYSYDSSLLVMKSKFDTSSQKSTLIISETLGKYGYKLDSSNKILKKTIGDSSKIRIKENANPILALSKEEDYKGIILLKHESGLFHYRINFISYEAGSGSYSLKCSFVVLDSTKGLVYFLNDELLSITSKITKDGSESAFISVPDIYRYCYLYVWVRGKYKNVDGTKEYNIDDLNYNNKNGNVFGSVKGATRVNIIQEVKKYEK